MIYKSANAFASHVLYNKENGYFDNNLTADVIEKLNISPKPVNKVMGVPGNGGGENGNCTDWYLTVYALDEYGNPLYIISESYLYTTCDNGGGPEDPDDPEEPQPTINFGEPDDTSISIDLVENLTESKIYHVSWYFYKVPNENLNFKSYEKITVKRNFIGPGWFIYGISHMSISPEGSITGQTASCVLNWTQGEINDIATWVKMTINFKDKRFYNYKGTPVAVYSNDIISSRTWGVGDLTAN